MDEKVNDSWNAPRIELDTRAERSTLIPDRSRRSFLKKAVSLPALLPAWPAMSPGLLPNRSHPVRFGKKLGEVFVEEGRGPVGILTEGSHRGRLVFDLSTLAPDSLIVPNDRFFIRTRYPDRLTPPARWKIRVHGHVSRSIEIDLEDLRTEVRPMGAHLLECSGNTRFRKFGLMSSAFWSGVPLSEVLERLPVTSRATRVLVSGFDEHSDAPSPAALGASWIFTIDELRDSRAFLATEMNGAPLPRDHGWPVRLVVPGWYGCTCTKWVNEIVLVDEGAPATSQMKEYAGRTHQNGVPELARDFLPARIEVAAMPVRVEKWLLDQELSYRVIGILWGGDRKTDSLRIRLNPEEELVPVESYEHETLSTWNLWSHTWRPSSPGAHAIELRVADPSIPTTRLDRGYYVRKVDIDEV